MRIFVGEYVCGGGLRDVAIDQIPTSLRQEGRAMLDAIVVDLAKVARTVVPIDPRLIDPAGDQLGDQPASPETSADKVSYRTVDSDKPLWNQWIDAASDCDAALIVAPESDGILAKAVAMLRAARIDVIAGSGDFLRTASDKLLTAKSLLTAGVAHPFYLTPCDLRYAEELKKLDRFVVKPRDGCGTQEIETFDSFDEAFATLDENLLMQAWVPGRPASVALVASHGQQTFLPTVSQDICDRTCRYSGGEGPLDDDSQRRATALAIRAIEAMPPTVRGFVGFDVVLGEDASQDYLIEINPRLTTSYVGLRHMVSGNLAARIFDLETGSVACDASVSTVRWNAQGKVSIDPTYTLKA